MFKKKQVRLHNVRADFESLMILLVAQATVFGARSPFMSAARATAIGRGYAAGLTTRRHHIRVATESPHLDSLHPITGLSTEFASSAVLV